MELILILMVFVIPAVVVTGIVLLVRRKSQRPQQPQHNPAAWNQQQR
ncbi:hypothetical protein [Streptomyces sp. NPDC026673]